MRRHGIFGPARKVVVEMTGYPENGERARGVITEVLGAAGEKDVDLRSVIVRLQSSRRIPRSQLRSRRANPSTPSIRRRKSIRRVDLSDQTICTIDPDDAKDYDDAISLRELDNGYWELGVHIADVAHFVPDGIGSG